MISSRGLKCQRPLSFIFLLIGLYLLFYYFTLFWIGVTAKGHLYWPFAEEHLNYIQIFRYFLLNSAAAVCNLFGYQATVIGEYRLRITGGSGIRLVYSCLGYGVMSFYAAFVLAWPTKSLKEKWMPLFGGLLLIVFLNILRLALLPIIYTENPAAKDFPIDHHDVFNGILYLVVMVILYRWTKVPATRKS